MEESFLSSVLKSAVGKVILGLGALYLIATVLERRVLRPDAREPPFIYSPVPFVGHIVKMASMGGNRFWQHLSDKVQLPIFTVPMFGGRLYIVTTPGLAGQVQKAAKTLEFQPFAIELTVRMLKLPLHVHEVIMSKRSSSKQNAQPQNLAEHIHDWQSVVLGPGQELDSMSVQQLSLMAQFVDEIGEGDVVDLFAWVKHFVTIANLTVVYGPRNMTSVNPSFEKDFWTFSRDMAVLMTGPISWLLAPRACLALERMKTAMRHWGSSGDWRLASIWIQERIRMGIAHGMTVEEAAEIELGMVFGLLANAMPSTFWVVAYVFSDEKLTAELRAHLERDDVVRVSDDGKTREISISAIKNACPLLASVFREILRIMAPMASIRSVTEETIVTGPDDRPYVLKKGAMVQTVGGVIHQSETIWGKDAKEFEPRRFFNTPNGVITQPADEITPQSGQDTKSKAKETVHPAAFRAFGGGVSLCPGRFFALMEIGGLAALLLLGYDMTDALDGGLVKVPEPVRDDAAPLHIMYPVTPLNVRVKRRKVYENVTWKFGL